MTKHKELLLGNKKVGETSFLSQHCEDGVFEWGFKDGEMMAEGLKHYMIKPKPLLGDAHKKFPIMKTILKKRRLAKA
jgi:hypothetical protein